MLIQSVVWGTCLVTPLLVAWGLQRQWLFPRPKNGEVLVAEHHQIDALMLPLGHRSLKGFMARPRAASGRFQGGFRAVSGRSLPQRPPGEPDLDLSGSAPHAQQPCSVLFL